MDILLRLLLISTFVLFTIEGKFLSPSKYIFRPHLNTGRIVGGEIVNITDIPHQISLQYYGNHVCGGSFIHQKWILTAAHCTQGSSVNSLKIRAGSNEYLKGGIIIPIKRIIVHQNFSFFSVDYDFSLLELIDWDSSNITFGTIKLPKHQDENVEDGELVQVSGWGNTLNPEESRDLLRAVKIPKVNQEKCQQVYANISAITPRMICAGYTEGGKDSCQGDSGGPLSLNDTLVGVVSWGMGCALPNYPGIYARVASVRNWIKEITNI